MESETEVNVPEMIIEIQSEQWNVDAIFRKKEFLDHIECKFKSWLHVMTKLCNEGKYGDHELIVQAIIKLGNHLDNVLAKEMEDFGIDIFTVGDRTVKVTQYFSPQPFYPDMVGTPLKHIRFTVYRGDEVLMHYFLESSDYDGLLYVLGKFTADHSQHSQIDNYWQLKPEYQHLKQTVITDLTTGIRPLLSSRRNLLVVHLD